MKIQINKQIIYTSLLLGMSIIFFGATGIDNLVEDCCFNFETSTWILDRNLAIYKLIFYDGIKKVLILFALSLLVSLLFFRNTTIIKEYKKGIIIVLLSAIFVPSVVGILKKTTNMPCPKDEKHYCGFMMKTAVWESYPPEYAKTRKIRCWPAGHASGGFALLSLSFLFKSKKAKLFSILLALVIGWSMGIYKMLIGDHFLSHTIITMLLAWLIILIVVKFVHKR